MNIFVSGNESLSICNNFQRIPIPMKKNPYYLTALQLLENENISYKETHLYEFYKTMHFKTFGDILGIDDLLGLSYDFIFIPWLHYKPFRKRNPTLLSDIMTNEWGKNSERIVEQEYILLGHLINSIEEHGYVPEKFNNKGINGWILTDGTISKLYAVKGNHRAAALTAMNKDFIFKVETGKVISDRIDFIQLYKSNESRKYLEDTGMDLNNNFYPLIFSSHNVGSWPAVKSGFLKEKQALKILDKYLGTENENTL